MHKNFASVNFFFICTLVFLSQGKQIDSSSRRTKVRSIKEHNLRNQFYITAKGKLFNYYIVTSRVTLFIKNFNFSMYNCVHTSNVHIN